MSSAEQAIMTTLLLENPIFLSFVHLLSHLPTYLFLIKNFEVCIFYVFKEEIR